MHIAYSGTLEFCETLGAQHSYSRVVQGQAPHQKMLHILKVNAEIWCTL